MLRTCLLVLLIVCVVPTVAVAGRGHHHAKHHRVKHHRVKRHQHKPRPTPTFTPTITATATVSATPTAPPSAGLVEDFSGPAGSTPNPALWVDWGKDCGYGDYASFGKIRCGADERLDGAGHLDLPADPTFGSAISTHTRFAQSGGTWTVWARPPAQPGYWPGVWVLNGLQAQEPTGEIDIAEVYTQWKYANSAAHFWVGATDVRKVDLLCSAAGDVVSDQAFHAFKLQWNVLALDFSVDGIACGSVARWDSWPFDPPGWLILDLAVGGGGQNTPPAGPAHFLIDRVQITP